MSLNLGPDGTKAAQELRTSDHFTAIREAVHEQARRAMNNALECSHEVRADAIGYARALRDLHVAFESAATGQMANRIEKPGSELKPAATRKQA